LILMSRMQQIDGRGGNLMPAQSRARLGMGLILVGLFIWVAAVILVPMFTGRLLGPIVGGALTAFGIVLITTSPRTVSSRRLGNGKSARLP
jgi:hypothetical protein